jgi:hypothetical protein
MLSSVTIPEYFQTIPFVSQDVVYGIFAIFICQGRAKRRVATEKPLLSRLNISIA